MKATGLLVKVRGASGVVQALSNAFGPQAVRPILSLPGAAAAGRALAPGAAALAAWYRIDGQSMVNPWDAAHQLAAQSRPGATFAAAGGIEFVEPDLEQSWWGDGESASQASAMSAAADVCTFHPQDPVGGKPIAAHGNAWNFGDAYSELAAARALVGRVEQERVRVAHLDTGYDPGHATLPVNLDFHNQRNFRDPEAPNDARDRTPGGRNATRNRGHGTATLALLAGNRTDGQGPSWPQQDYVGGAPFVSVVPIRIADWVVRFSTSTMVQGFQHAVNQQVHVLSMSMGGLTSRALVDAVNLAYDSGIFIVTAAGNNFARMPSPKSVVFPARFRRVLAACGVMADGRAYTGLDARAMQGNFGPASKMMTALAGYTPNVPWAEFGCGKLVSMDGAGTSAATPQLAAAAALWIAKYWEELAAYPAAWMRVEAVRQALFAAASTQTDALGPEETLAMLGRGVLRAAAALAVKPALQGSLEPTPPAESSWGWLNLIFGSGGVSLAPGVPDHVGEMFRIELTQMAQRVQEVDAAITDCDVDPGVISQVVRTNYLEAALDAGNPSKPLKTFLERRLGRVQIPSGLVPAVAPTAPIKRKAKMLPSPQRRLRVYALDPSIAKSLASASINETVLNIVWEENLLPGPVGEYIEVVDVDPASNRLYDPVDLNEPKALAQDGWPPSEGNPEFHQQMVYAVAMHTIGNFEEALGRRVLWAPRWGKPEKEGAHPKAYEVPRLRIYPHALRTDNAYYSPDKLALLFGYFQASSSPDEATPNGSMVFSCLSSDIIAHEMSHALLDGLHRKFQEASNPDVPAFHEGFADIVAIFQHFAIPELVRFQIARARGNLDAATLLSSLAQQFGEGIGRRGALRDYLGKEIAELSYDKTTEVHARGSILVWSVYQAFLSIVNNRTSDLIRIATNGTGILPVGALHPDLVNRLSDETCKAARHVLRMCIRALDYCPAVDITFGEYLRALITADIDLVADDRFHYRIAFMEAFRRRGLLPRDVRTVSERTLAWGTLEDPRPDWVGVLLKEINFGWDRTLDRSAVFKLNETNRWKIWTRLRDLLRERPELHVQFGLLPDVPKYDFEGKVMREAEPGATTFDVASVRPARRIAPDGSFRLELVATILQRRRVPVDTLDPDGPTMWFRGGATLILDPRSAGGEVRYAIVKNCGSESRLERQRQMVASPATSPLRALYFGDDQGEPFALLHGRLGGGCRHV